MELSSEGRGRGRGRGRTDLGVKVENGEMLRIGDGVMICFKRTLRVPNDYKPYGFYSGLDPPPSLGYFPIGRVPDYANKVPESWRRHGGLFLPVYQREDVWLEVSGSVWNPRAMKVGIGKMCALTGQPWSEELHQEPEDYLLLPSQPQLLDASNDTICQYITMPLQRQVTGEEIQIRIFEPNKALVFPVGVELGLGSGAGLGGRLPGLRLWHTIRCGTHGLDAWDQSSYATVFVHLCSPAMWRDITGEAPPESPVSAQTYASHGLPWFDVYDEGREGVDDFETLKDMDQLLGSMGDGPQVLASVSSGFPKEGDEEAISRYVLARFITGLTSIKQLQ